MMISIVANVSQGSLLLYRRAETANREILELLGRLEPEGECAALHQQAVALSLDLDRVLGQLLRLPMEPDPSPVSG